MTYRSKFLGAAAALAVAAPFAASAQETETKDADTARVEIGYLECSLLSKSGNIIKAEEEFSCVFDPAAEGMTDEVYVASVEKWGINLSDIEQETVRWAVMSSADPHENGVLEGEYAGVGADIAAGLGLGVNAMVGGSDKSIALQPVSVTTQEGIGIAAGVETLELTFVGDELE